MLLSDESKCFAFLAGHESFAAAEGAIGIVRNANKARKEPLRVILNGLGKDAAQIISRINGFTYVQTQFDYFTGKLNIVREIRYSETERADVRCYGADDVREALPSCIPRAWTSPSPVTPPTRPASSTPSPAPTRKSALSRQEVFLRRLRRRHGPYPAPGQHGRRPRLLWHDRYHGPHAFRRTVCRLLLRARARGNDGFLGMGNNPMVGATVAVAVAVAESLK